MYKVVDLFAGAGGLSLGFRQTGKFEIIVAAENNPDAQKTYHRNHPNTTLYGDVREINYGELKREFGDIDVLIGGPPCQGFSNANRQKAKHISSNNELVKEYIRAIRELQPSIFVMENVRTILSETHRFYYSEDDAVFIEQSGISCRTDTIEIMPPNDRIERYREELMQVVNEKVDKYLWDSIFYQTLNTIYKKRKNEEKAKKSINSHKNTLLNHCEKIARNTQTTYFVDRLDFVMQEIIVHYLREEVTFEEFVSAIEFPILLQRMFQYIQELNEHNIKIDAFDYTKGICVKVRSYSVQDYLIKMLENLDVTYTIKSDVLKAVEFGVPQKRERFILMGNRINTDLQFPVGFLDETQYRTVFDAISDLEEVPTSIDVDCEAQPVDLPINEDKSPLAFLRNSDLIYNHIVTKTGKIAKERFENIPEGGNFHSLPDSLKSTYTDVARTQNTIYYKPYYRKPCGTVVNLRKSMWIHPTKNRAFSVREAARLQTFPDSFVFEGNKNSQYQQIGNAVPPILAKAIANSVLPQLQEKDE